MDLNAISAIAIGVVNPKGVGQVSFTLKEAHFLQVEEAAEEPVAVEVTGKLLAVGETSHIPVGVFGAYNLKTQATGEQPYVEVDGEQVPVVGAVVNKGGRVVEGTVTIDGKEWPVKNSRVTVRRMPKAVEGTDVEAAPKDDKKKKKKKSPRQSASASTSLYPRFHEPSVIAYTPTGKSTTTSVPTPFSPLTLYRCW